MTTLDDKLAERETLVKNLAALDAEIEVLRTAAMNEGLQQIKEITEKLGIAPELVAKVIGYKAKSVSSQAVEEEVPAKKTRKKVPPKYQHPQDPAITWNGQGKTPNWVTTHVANGGTRDDLLINKP